ncbi:hypothetical protein [Clostridium sp. UBA871]|uniref:hypothetical protein n=1 Tax=Clostridium sp. UBA871 TaxID=1946380 RepID=UPI0032167D27
MKKKILLSLLLVAGLGITGFATTAEAGDISDKPFKFYFSINGSINSTDRRSKYDSTSAYMRMDWIEKGAGEYRVKVVDENGKNFSKTWWSRYFSYGTPRGTEARIANHAYEDRGYGVKIKLQGEGHGGAVSSGIWSTSGVWSPDSV